MKGNTPTPGTFTSLPSFEEGIITSHPFMIPLQVGKKIFTVLEVFIQYFKNLFSSSLPNFFPLLDKLITCDPNVLDTKHLLVIPNAYEIRNIVFTKKNGKSFYHDGVFPTFFKHYWSTINGKVTDVVQYFFVNGYMLKSLNHTFIFLVPKKDNTGVVEHFRPIYLCNVVYNIITKLLSDSLDPL